MREYQPTGLKKSGFNFYQYVLEHGEPVYAHNHLDEEGFSQNKVEGAFFPLSCSDGGNDVQHIISVEDLIKTK